MNIVFVNCIYFFLSCFLFVSACFAQKGDLKDKPNTVQVENWKNFNVPESPILSPEQALKTFKIQGEFRLEVAAAEPLVNDPVAIAWDEFGRMYVVEMWTFMPDVDGHGEALPKGRVVVLEDVDKDGLMDRSTVYLDNLVMPRAISVVKGGVLIAEPPNLWFCEDTNNDLVCDNKRKVASYAKRGSVEHMENGLLTGIDNWIYNAKSTRKFRWDGKKLQEKTTGSRGQWGMSMDNYGRLFTANNSVPLIADIYPFSFNNRNPGYKSRVGTAVALLTDTNVYARRVNTGVNRGYRKGSLRKDGRLGKATAASGPGVYRGDKYPEEYLNNAFFTEPAANLIGRVKIRGDGIDMSAERMLYDDPIWDKLDFITSTDERFRPVNITTGPDGYLYVVDMYRGILQHKEFLTSYLRKQIIERGLDKPVGLGRIYRLVPEGDSGDYSVPSLGNSSESTLIQVLSSRSGWQRDTAQRLLVQKNQLKKKSIKRLEKMARSGEQLAAIHALWVLHGQGLISEKNIFPSLRHDSHWVRIHAMRVADELFSGSKKLSDRLYELLLDNSPSVRLQAYQNLGALTDKQVVVNHILNIRKTDSHSPHFIDACVSSLDGVEKIFIDRARAGGFSSQDEGKAKLLEALAVALYTKKDVDAVLSLLNKVAPKTSWVDAAVLNGVLMSAENKALPPLELMHKPEVMLSDATRFSEAERGVLENAFHWPGKKVLNSLANLTQQQKKSIKRGKIVYENLCAGCHQFNGEGMASLAPELSDSAWVNDSVEMLALIITHGISGPIDVNGKRWDSVMPAHGAMPQLQGKGLSDLMSYIRSSWANTSGPVNHKKVKNILQRYQGHTGMWTVEKLNAAVEKKEK